MRAPRTPFLAATAVLVGGLGFFAGSLTAADAGSAPRAKPVTTGQVKRIATKQARKEIAKAAPTLRVAHAASADTAGSAGTAQIATALSKPSELPFGVLLNANTTTPVVLVNLPTLTLSATCPGFAPPAPTLELAAPAGRFRWQRVAGASTVSSGGDVDTGPITAVLSGGFSGTGSLAFLAPNGEATTATYGWRQDGAGCSIFGTVQR